MADTKKYLHNLDVSNNKVINPLLNPLTTAQRLAVGATLGLADQGYAAFDTTTNELYFWDGAAWILSSGLTTWGSITGLITNQIDLINYLSANYYPLTSNPAGYLTAAVANTLYYPLSSNPAGYLTSSSISGMVTGSGTLNYVPKWTPTGVQLGDSQIYDDGNYVRVGNGGGSMGFPYETLILEANKDMKFGTYTSVSAFGLGGAAYVLGYTGVTTASGYYPGFEFQHIGNLTESDNFIRYNFILRNGAGTVNAAAINLIDIYPTGKIVINPTTIGPTSVVPVPQLILGLNTSVYALDIESTLYSRISSLGGSGTQMVVADNNGVLSVQAIPTGAITAVTASSPLFSSGGSTPNITIQQASGSQDGYLSSTDWTTFNSKQSAITLTTTGTSGAATFIGNTLNIPQYQAALTNPVTGTGVATRVAFWDTTSSISSDADLYWDNINKRLGIGTITPGYKLEVNGQSYLAGNVGIQTPPDNTHRLKIGNGGGIFITSGGTPYVYYNCVDSLSNNTWTTENQYDTGAFNIAELGATTIAIKALKTSGNVIIGGNSSSTTSYKLDVLGNQNISGKLNFTNPNNVTQIRIGTNNDNVGGAHTGGDSVIIGSVAGSSLLAAGGTSLVAVGRYAGGTYTSGGISSTHIGRNSGVGITTGSFNTHVGMHDSTNMPSNTSYTLHLIGAGGYELNNAARLLSGLTSKYALIGGGYNYATYVNDFYLGAGPFITEPQLANLSIYAPSSTTDNTAGGTWNGTDAPGSNFTLNAGRGTGTGTPGDFIIKTSNLTGAGNTLQTLVERLRVKGDTGRVGIGIASPLYPLDVVGEINTNVGIRLGTNGAQTGIYGGANIFDFWAGNNKIATWGLTAPGGTHYDHFASPVYNTGDTGITSIFKIRGSITSVGANTAGASQLDISPIYTQQTFGTGTLRGVYYHPQINSLNGSTHIAWENTTGDIIHGNLSGLGTRMVTADSAGKLSTTTFSANGLRSGIAAGTDTYTVTIAGVTSYAVNDTYVIQFTNANTGASTLDINGLGAVNLYKYDDVLVLAGDIGAGQQFIVSYDGANFQMIGMRPNQLFAFITNDDSVTINKGQPVYAFGAAGNRMSVKLAYNTSDATSARTLGLVYSSSIAPNQTGFIIIQGVIENINTAAYSPGNVLYLGATAGTLTNVKPYAPNHLVYIGIVERANAGNGQIYVRTQNGYELDEIHDVDLITTPPTNNQVLAYESATQLWKNKSLSALGAGTVTSVSASMVTPAQTVTVTNPTTTPAISIDDSNLLHDKFMVRQYSYFLPTDGATYSTQRVVTANLLTTGTVSGLSENPAGILYSTTSTIGSVAGRYGSPFGGGGYLGVNFTFDFVSRFRINTNNGSQRFFCGMSSLYNVSAPTNVEPTSLLNILGVAKLQGSPNLFFVWNDGTGTASNVDLGSGFLGTETTSTYKLRIWKAFGSTTINLELTKIVNSTGVVTVVSQAITSDYNTGVNYFPVCWISTNTAGVVSFKDYGAQVVRNNFISA